MVMRNNAVGVRRTGAREEVVNVDASVNRNKQEMILSKEVYLKNASGLSDMPFSIIIPV